MFRTKVYNNIAARSNCFTTEENYSNIFTRGYYHHDSPLHFRVCPHLVLPPSLFSTKACLSYYFASALHRPLCTQRKPLYAQRRPWYTQRRPWYTQCRPLYTQRRPLYTQRRPLYTQRRPLCLFGVPMRFKVCREH
ncbi:hypothetical protein F4604DRAFT_1687739 [Suillus subluteus]|nr:hypothetical protein F4604DRAFT_1687739 [Suillus subluteus]